MERNQNHYNYNLRSCTYVTLRVSTELCVSQSVHKFVQPTVAAEFCEELHLATCTPGNGLDELERSGLSNSKFIFNNGGNYSHPELQPFFYDKYCSRGSWLGSTVETL